MKSKLQVLLVAVMTFRCVPLTLFPIADGSRVASCPQFQLGLLVLGDPSVRFMPRRSDRKSEQACGSLGFGVQNGTVAHGQAKLGGRISSVVRDVGCLILILRDAPRPGPRTAARLLSTICPWSCCAVRSRTAIAYKGYPLRAKSQTKGRGEPALCYPYTHRSWGDPALGLLSASE